jgi:hypothetical protein
VIGEKTDMLVWRVHEFWVSGQLVEISLLTNFGVETLFDFVADIG